MTTVLLTSCQAVIDDLNDDSNIFSKGSLRYSPSAYVRHFKCTEPTSFHSIDLSRGCCSLDSCPAPKLERLLHAHGCQDRFWDANGGANQPKGLCNPPSAITNAIKEADNLHKEQARKARAEAAERARKEQIQRDLDAAAAADRRRERDRLRVLEEERAAEIRATNERAAAEAWAIQQRAQAEEAEIRRLAAVEAQEAEAKRQRELREYNTKRERERAIAQEQAECEMQRDRRTERTLRERSNVQINQKKREANIQKEVLKEEKNLFGEKRRLVDSATGMFREAGYSGVNKVGMGRVLGEIDR